jgi:hypothetical protein
MGIARLDSAVAPWVSWCRHSTVPSISDVLRSRHASALALFFLFAVCRWLLAVGCINKINIARYPCIARRGVPALYRIVKVI